VTESVKFPTVFHSLYDAVGSAIDWCAVVGMAQMAQLFFRTI